MQIVETAVFSKQVQKELDTDSYRLLQVELIRDPEAGSLMRGSGGLRKIRWAGSGRGKRGGVRVIYYWHRPGDLLLMLLAYPKNVQDDLTAAQRKALRHLVEEELR